MVILIIRTVYRQIAIARFGLLKKDPGRGKESVREESNVMKLFLDKHQQRMLQRNYS